MLGSHEGRALSMVVQLNGVSCMIVIRTFVLLENQALSHIMCGVLAGFGAGSLMGFEIKLSNITALGAGIHKVTHQQQNQKVSCQLATDLARCRAGRGEVP